MTKANDYQVGGEHYKQPPGVPQHWDLSIMYQWDGFQHCITKYLMRWKTKYPQREKKLEDLKKAAHMLQKYIENYEAFLATEVNATPENSKRFSGYDELNIPVADVIATPGAYTFLSKFETEAPVYLHDNNFLCEGGYGDGMNLYTCKACRKKVMARGLEHARQVHTMLACTGATITAPAPAGEATDGSLAAGQAPAAGPAAPQE